MGKHVRQGQVWRESEAIGVRGSLADQGKHMPFLSVRASLVLGSPMCSAPRPSMTLYSKSGAPSTSCSQARGLCGSQREAKVC